MRNLMFAFTLFVVGCSLASGQDSVYSFVSEQKISGGGSDPNGSPAITALRDGRFIVSWHNDGWGTSGLGRIFSADGTPTGAEFSLNPNTGSGWRYGHVVAQLPDGGIASFFGYSSSPMLVQQFDAALRPVRSAFTLDLGNRADWPAVGSLPNGQVVVMGTHPNESRHVMKIHLDGNLNSIGSPVAASENLPGRGLSTAMAVAPSGIYTMAWYNSAGNIIARTFDMSGTPLGGEYIVNSSTGGTRDYPSLTYNSRNELWIAWSGQGDGDTRGIFARRFAADGRPLGAEWRVNEYVRGDQERPQLATGIDDTVAMSWTSPDDQGVGVFARAFYSNGIPASGEFQVNQVQGGDQVTGWAGGRRGTYISGQRLIFTWKGNGAQGFGIYMTIFQRSLPPFGLDLSPFQGAGVTQTFTGTFTDANGWTDIAKVNFRFHESYAGTAGACIVEMRPQTGQITLLDDAGVSYLTPVALGSATPLQNNACSVDALNSTFTGSGNVLTANVALTFKPAFGSAGGREPRKAVCQWAKDTAGAGEDQSCFGMWLPEAPSPVKIPRYRLYNPANYAHFFTASQNERDVLVTRGFTPEDPPPGMAYNQPAIISGISTHPFYRILFFPQNGAPIFHYWTRDREEYKTAVRNRTLNLGEGMDSFLLSGQAPGTYPTYRMRFTAGPTAYPIYHYALQAEHDALLGFGWGVSLGVDGYLQPMPAPLAQVTAGLQTPPRKVIAAVLSAASHESGPVAPGQLIRVYGNNFSKFARAFVDDSAVQLTAVTERYIELAVPETVAGRESIALFVDDLGVRTEAVTVPVTPANPAVFVKDFLGRGIVETLPSDPGTITLQVTGAGELDLGQPKLPLTVRLNGYPAEIISISAIADQPGRLAVNVKLPAEVLAGDTDLATVSLQAGEANAQPGLLARVK